MSQTLDYLQSDSAERRIETGLLVHHLLDDAIKVVAQTNQASVSILQRRLRIGYTRAARIMDLLELRGVVGPYKGSKARDILIETISEHHQEPTE